MRKNFHHSANPEKEVTAYFEQYHSTHRVFWDKTAHGLIIALEAKGTSADRSRYYDQMRYHEIKTRDDLKEVFYNYEDGE